MNTRNPKMRAFATSLAIALAVIATSSAADQKKDEKPSEQPPPEVAEPAPSPIAATDAALRESFKEYVGLRSSEEKGVFLTFAKGADLDAAANLAREVWVKTEGKDGGGKLPNFEFVEALATPEELKEARLKMRDVLTLKDVVFLDLDESCGCIVIGAITKEVTPRIASFIKEHGINSRWVTIVETPKYRLTSDLTDRFRPTMGGQEIRTIGNSCTLGLPVYSWLMHAEGILTASHCTQGPQGDNWATSFLQGPSSQDFIADESLDLGLFDNTRHPDCPDRRFCRYSDVVFANYAGNLGIRGRVTRPSTMCATGMPCSLTVDRPTDDIRIVQATAGLFTGTVVDKIGKRSGWTSGAITNTCTDVNVVEVDSSGTVNDTDHTMLCQTLVSTTALPGDSGAPVFQFHPDYGVGDFGGILWGANLNYTSMVFSPIDGIERDLGTFVFNQAGVSGTFFSNGQFYTSNVDDTLSVVIDRNAVASGEVEIVLNAGSGITDRKEIVLVEGPGVGSGRWTIFTDRNHTSARDGLYLYQLPGGVLEFRKSINGVVSEVSRLPIDKLAGGTRVTFTWQAD